MLIKMYLSINTTEYIQWRNDHGNMFGRCQAINWPKSLRTIIQILKIWRAVRVQCMSRRPMYLPHKLLTQFFTELCLGDLEFKSRPRDRPSWQVVCSFLHSLQPNAWLLPKGKLRSFQSTMHPTIQCCIAWAINSVVKPQILNG